VDAEGTQPLDLIALPTGASATAGSTKPATISSEQDARALVARLTSSGRLVHIFGPGRGGYLYLIDGRLRLEGDSMTTGDAAKVTGDATLEMTTDVAAEVILIDVPLEFQPVGVWAGEP
jgi:redox-sensitive bicupin YhaK (pirin superfamily)